MKPAKLILAALLGLLLGHFVHVANTSFISTQAQPTISVSGPVIKTVSHTTLAEDRFKLIYKDTESDTAYYEILDPIHWAENGDTVSFVNGAHGTIVNSDTQGFMVSLDDDNFVISSMSGTAVYRDKDQVGFVSARVNDLIRCIWY